MKIISILLPAAIAANSFAQQSAPPPPPDPKKEKVEAMHIAFLTNKLDLTPEEAQKFWPVYNEFQKKREELNVKRKQDKKSMRHGIDSLSDKQVEALVDAEIAFRQKNLDMEKEYHAKFKSILPIKKVAKLYKAEEQFTHHLLEQISKKGKHDDNGKKKGDLRSSKPPDEH